MRSIGFLSARAAALLLAVSFVTSAAAQTPAPAVPTAPAAHTATTSPALRAFDLSRIDIKNFGRVNDNYYRGAQPKGRDYADLAALGIKTVIDLQADFKAEEEQLVKQAGMNFVRIPMTTRVAPTAAQIEQFLTLVSDTASGPVYVHCAGGRHRTGVMTAVYRMTSDKWSADQAFSEMKRFKFGMDFLHPEFKKFVYAYPQQLERAANPAPALLN